MRHIIVSDENHSATVVDENNGVYSVNDLIDKLCLPHKESHEVRLIIYNDFLEDSREAQIMRDLDFGPISREDFEVLWKEAYDYIDLG